MNVLFTYKILFKSIYAIEMAHKSYYCSPLYYYFSTKKKLTISCEYQICHLCAMNRSALNNIEHAVLVWWTWIFRRFRIALESKWHRFWRCLRFGMRFFLHSSHRQSFEIVRKHDRNDAWKLEICDDIEKICLCIQQKLLF